MERNRMIQEKSRILFNYPVKDNYHKIGLTCDPAYGAAVAGQFVTLKILGRMDPLLRRPFSIHRVLRSGRQIDGIEIVYRVVGGFTAQLSEMEKDDTIDLLGPIGRGFTLSSGLTAPIMAAGGIGVAPIVFLAESLRAAGADLSRSAVFLGGRTESDILCLEDFAELDIPVHVSTDDGSLGHKGLVTELLEEALTDSPHDILYACGPHGMLRAVADLAQLYGVPCEVSIETVMACGLGVCMGCAVKTKDYTHGYRHICKDGPVFDASVVVF
jgi:dihydroorotate dehydrogenase electron transfer subunit